MTRHGFCETGLRQAPRDIKPKRFGMTWNDISTAIKLAHQSIAHHFHTGAGKRLQRIDSDVAEQVMIDFIKHGIAILPVHDSFLVHEGHEGGLEAAKKEALWTVCGADTKLKLVDLTSALSLPTWRRSGAWTRRLWHRNDPGHL